MRVYVVLVALALLAGCSGSNDPVNNNPTISVTSPVSINEGVTDVTTVTVADPDSQDTLVVSLNGADAALFSINASNQISFSAAQRFATSADTDGNNQRVLSDGLQSDFSRWVTDGGKSTLYQATVTRNTGPLHQHQ